MSPIATASKISEALSLKYGNTYIKAPVDIITGGMMILRNVSGRLAARCLTIMAPIPMMTAIMDAAVNKMLSMPMA